MSCIIHEAFHMLSDGIGYAYNPFFIDSSADGQYMRCNHHPLMLIQQEIQVPWQFLERLYLSM